MAVFPGGFLQICLRALLPLALLVAIVSHQRPAGSLSLRGGHLRSSGPAWDEGRTQGTAPRRTADSISEDEPSAGCNCEPAAQDPQSMPLPLFVTLPIIIALVLLSGLFSGLTLGLLSLDVIGLQTVQKGDNQELAQCAEKIYPVRRAGNQLLCTLLLGNVAVNSAISILTADIADGLIGFLVSTTLILLFGEIIPQAACSRYALQVGARAVPVVKVLLVLFYVIAKPLSIALDYMLGKEVGTIYSPTELMEMVKLQISLGACGEVEGKMAKQVAEGALCFRDKRVEEVMTPVEDVYMLSAGCCLGYETIREIFETGFSRIPVYGRDKHDYLGILNTKDLMLADPEDEMRLGDFIQIFNRRSETFFKDTKLVSVLNAFKKGGTHIGLIREVNTESDIDPRMEVRGIVTLEDVVEEILQEEIVDETDVYVDVDHHVRVGDGREARIPPLGLFNPAWRRHRERPSREETTAVAAHLQRTVFVEGSKLELSTRAVEWLVNAAGFRTRARVTPQSFEEPEERDWLYTSGVATELCTLVLQGRLGLRVGRQRFRAEAGAFSVLAAEALLPGAAFIPDFGAYLLTPTVRFLTISRALLREAQALDLDKDALERAFISLDEEPGEQSRGEVLRLNHLGQTPKRKGSPTLSGEGGLSNDAEQGA